MLLYRLRFTFLAITILSATSFAQQKGASSAKTATNIGIDLKGIDKSVDPCTDFYQYACGNWRKNNPIPPDQARWGHLNELAERNNLILKQILEQASNAKIKRNAVDQKIGDYYGACMDEAAINQRGVAALDPDLDAIANMKSKDQLVDVVSRIHKENGPGFFGFGSGQDAKDSTSVIAQFGQDGLGLPNRDYYLNQDAKTKQTREQYLQHVTRMFLLMGDPQEKAEAEANAVMKIETSLAKGSYGPVDVRDPVKTYHKMTLAEFEALTPSFSYAKYLQGLGAPKIDVVNVGEPEFAKTMETVIDQSSVDDLKTYMRWQLVHANAALLPTQFVDENFAFYGKTLLGAKQLRPRWKRCVAMTDNALGEALGIAFVQKTFGKEGKDRMLEMVNNLEGALGSDIQALSWMTPETKKQALVKLRAIANKIGYPDKWRDYSSVKIVPGDAMGNNLRANTFEEKRQLDKIGKPVDKQEWGMTPPTVNAYYDPFMNNINFPAGILQPPFFDRTADDAANYGSIGAVIGHELTHGFDNQGRQFDAQGNLRDWWTATDSKAFDQRADCVVNEYGNFVAVDDVKLNGKLTLGENLADNGGVRIALMAYLDSLKGKADAAKKRAGYTPEQRFFVGFGQVWCENQRPEAERLQALTNEHSPGEFRVNGTVRNMPEFRKAFGCKIGQPMAPQNSCHVW